MNLLINLSSYLNRRLKMPKEEDVIVVDVKVLITEVKKKEKKK